MFCELREGVHTKPPELRRSFSAFVRFEPGSGFARGRGGIHAPAAGVDQSKKRPRSAAAYQFLEQM